MNAGVADHTASHVTFDISTCRIEPVPDATEQGFRFYHDGSRKRSDRNRDGSVKAPPVEERPVIAWDMEGMNLSGAEKPQHPVVYGCSADPGGVLISRRLSTKEMLEYIIHIGRTSPHAIHVGYGFRYDANMLLQDFPENLIARLWKTGEARFGPWYIRWIPGKIFMVSKRGPSWHATRNKKDKVCVTIYDYSSFFNGEKFLDSAEQILQGELSTEDKDVIAHGKDARGDNEWSDLEDVVYYWRREIQLIRRVFERFRDVMCRAGFPLREWYGPGALANYIIAQRKLRTHMQGAQTTSGIMPESVHSAVKHAFSGGRFELYQAGRHVASDSNKIKVADVNNAYPFALTMIPSLAEGTGEWVHRDAADIAVRGVERFGFYRIVYRAPDSSPFEFRPMPLFWRDHEGLISFPQMAHGWYASPEARMVQGMPGAEILEGWIWDYDQVLWEKSGSPWHFLGEMYATRQRLGKQNLLSIPFKLGPNSLYGKYAQTVGWDRKRRLPPKSHALPIAAWITSFTRAKLWSVISQIPERVIAVETDSVFFTGDMPDITVSDELGDWSVKEYDELVYLQSGMYHSRDVGSQKWTGTKSRGLSRVEYPLNAVRTYLQSLSSDATTPRSLTLTTKAKFVGAGAALASTAPFKSLHCAWIPQTRKLTFGETGKRRHVQTVCEACKNGSTPWDEPHRLIVASRSDGETLSHSRRLPWEAEHSRTVQNFRDAKTLEQELITR